MDGQIGVGIDVGGTKILLVALDAERELVGEIRVDSPGDLPGLRGDAIAPALAELTAAVASRANIALGAALPGLVDVAGVLRGAPNLGENEGTYDLQAELAAPLLAALGEHAAPVPVALVNDATAAAYAEARLGAARGHDDVISVSLGTGIGAGVVVGGRLAAGARGYAGEIGHMLVDPNGPICGCGRRGCWEAAASGSALGRLAADSGFGPGGDHVVRGEDVVAAARNGDETAEKVIRRYARLVAVGLANACELLDPAIIVLGGGIITAADVLLEPIRDAFVEISRPAQQRRRDDIVPATLGPKAAAIGAALLALEGEPA